MRFLWEKGASAMRCVKMGVGQGGRGQRGKRNPYSVQRKSFGDSGLRITHRRSPFIYDAGFTLIELLVVISIVAFLMAILMPALQRARRQAKAMACQAKLHQWGLAFAAYTSDYNGQFYPWAPAMSGGTVHWPYGMGRYFGNSKDLLLCPVATKPFPPDGHSGSAVDKFSAWRMPCPGAPGDYYEGSYAQNGWICRLDHPDVSYRGVWTTALVRNAHEVPVLVDAMDWALVYSDFNCQWTPPPFEGEVGDLTNWSMNLACIERHSGGVNGLFMDWSVRKIGLKELWTLKWNREYDTHGPWTKAGGVKAEDWPEWMRRFKDY